MGSREFRITRCIVNVNRSLLGMSQSIPVPYGCWQCVHWLLTRSREVLHLNPAQGPAVCYLTHRLQSNASRLPSTGTPSLDTQQIYKTTNHTLNILVQHGTGGYRIKYLRGRLYQWYNTRFSSVPISTFWVNKQTDAVYTTSSILTSNIIPYEKCRLMQSAFSPFQLLTGLTIFATLGINVMSLEVISTSYTFNSSVATFCCVSHVITVLINELINWQKHHANLWNGDTLAPHNVVIKLRVLISSLIEIN